MVRRISVLRFLYSAEASQFANGPWRRRDAQTTNCPLCWILPNAARGVKKIPFCRPCFFERKNDAKIPARRARLFDLAEIRPYEPLLRKVKTQALFADLHTMPYDTTNPSFLAGHGRSIASGHWQRPVSARNSHQVNRI
jgi:hypothetical protein